MPRILIVDDDPITLDLLYDLLRVHMPNVAVDVVGSSIIARKRLKANAYDLLVTDLRMPEISGATLGACPRNPALLCGQTYGNMVFKAHEQTI